MAVDRLTTEWHLARDGWISGTTRFFGKPQGEIIEPPSSRLATFEHEIYQRSMWSAEELRWREVWRAEDLTDEELAELIEKYPIPEAL